MDKTARKYKIYEYISGIGKNEENVLCRVGLQEDDFSEKTAAESFLLHSHAYSELIFITEGNITFLYNNHSFSVGKGDLLIVDPYVQHCEVPKGKFGYYAVGVKNFTFSADERNFILKSEKEYETLYFYFYKIMEEARNKPDGYKKIIENIFENITILIGRKMQENHNVVIINEKIDGVVAVVKTYIETYYQQNISIELLSKISYISPQHLIRIFHRSTGYTPAQYLKRVRIQIAGDQLLSRDNTIKQIAEQVGYNNLQSFLYSFKKIAKMSPSEFRNRYKTTPFEGKQIVSFTSLLSEQIPIAPYKKKNWDNEDEES